jgi:type 1 glutamine amidotransferase
MLKAISKEERWMPFLTGQKFRFSIILLLLFLFYGTAIQAKDKAMINVLLFSGRNNHQWQKTTPLIKTILEESGKFKVTVTNHPEKTDPKSLQQYDLIISNWNTWPEVTGHRWNTALEKAFLKFIASGKGFLNIHAGSSTLQDWPEFQQIAGGTWGKGVTNHGPVHIFKVKITDRNHPVMMGLKDFYIKDELWNATKFHKDIHILCTAYSTPESKGSGKDEPVAVTTKYGKGRGFYLVIGHNKATMLNRAWQTLLLRAAQWTAGRNVTIPAQKPWPDSKDIADRQSKYFEQSDSTLALISGAHVVWQFNFKRFGKPYFHPLNNIKGHSLTWLSPPDHPWHYALWFSWKYINHLNYWEESRKTHLAKGLTELTSKNFQLNDDLSVKIELDLSYHPPDAAPVLREERTIIISPPDTNGNFNIDWQSIFQAGDKDAVLERTPVEGQEGGRRWGGYATLSLRFNSPVFKDVNLLNNNGLHNLDIHTKPTKWVDISGTDKKNPSQAAGITIFDNPQNPRFPCPGYVINSPIENSDLYFIYTNPGFLYNSGYTIKAGKSLKLRYRIYVHNEIGELNELNRLFNLYSAEAKHIN